MTRRAVLALAACAVIALGALPRPIRVRPDVASPELQTNTAMQSIEPSDDSIFPPRVPHASSIIEAFGTLVIAATVIGVVVAAIVLIRSVRRRRATPEPVDDGARFAHLSPGPIRSADTAAATAALADLTRSPSDRVIGAWVEFERAAARRVGARTAATTPAAWARDRLVASGAAPGDVDALIALYYRARFRPGTRSGDGDVARARDAVAAISRRLA